ncbi:TolB family protein [Hymenobacter monticola]|uniref:Uncharacterized protein n=1 Tax=Hymenobacter monticola TaxID=1705399 RepID=A0ABY4B5Z0_9BACT|nr:hypothetical protein [Hymenobacter monticola]UOE34594.1 hypothetical protein MTP16_02820 [Hymenobacter monticola]
MTALPAIVRAWGRWLAGPLGLAAGLAGCSLPDIPLPLPPPAAEPEAVDPPCVNIPNSASWLGYQSLIEGNALWYSGCFNPANADEAAVVAELPGLTGGAYGLYRLNLRTHQYQLLFDGVASKTATWSRTGWIAFLRGGELWKVKANGDSARQFTATNRSLNGIEDWSPDGSRILCWYRAASYAQTGLAIYSATGAFVRLLPDAGTRAFEGIGWSPDGQRLAYAGGPNSPASEPRLCLYSLATNQLDTLNVLPQGSAGLWGVQWLPNGREVAWAASTGVSVTDLTTRRTRQLRGSCPITSASAIPSHEFGRFDVSADGQRLLVARLDAALSSTTPNLLLERYSLETMSPQGNQIRKVTP